MRKQGKLASKDVGAKSITYLDYPDNQMDTVPLLNIIKDIEKFILKFKPDTIFTHFDNDMNIDHTIANKATLTAARSKPGIKIKKIYAFEIMSSTYYNPSANFIPNYHINIDKIELLHSDRPVKKVVFFLKVFKFLNTSERCKEKSYSLHIESLPYT